MRNEVSLAEYEEHAHRVTTDYAARCHLMELVEGKGNFLQVQPILRSLRHLSSIREAVDGEATAKACRSTITWLRGRRRRLGRTTEYPWDLWLDGNEHLVQVWDGDKRWRPTDRPVFTCSEGGVRAVMSAAAQKAGKRASVRAVLPADAPTIEGGYVWFIVSAK